MKGDNFQNRYIEYYGTAVQNFVEEYARQFFILKKLPSVTLRVYGVTKQRLNCALNDYLNHLGYTFEQQKGAQNGKQIRYHVLHEQPNDMDFDARRAWYLERFLSNYDFLLHGKGNKISISSVLADYKYWFNYRHISMFYGYNEATILHNLVEWLRAKGAYVVVGAKMIAVNNDQNGNGSASS